VQRSAFRFILASADPELALTPLRWRYSRDPSRLQTKSRPGCRLTALLVLAVQAAPGAFDIALVQRITASVSGSRWKRCHRHSGARVRQRCWRPPIMMCSLPLTMPFPAALVQYCSPTQCLSESVCTRAYRQHALHALSSQEL